jgi:hypothetical protein
MVRVNADGSEDVERLRTVARKPFMTAESDRGRRVNRMIRDHVAKTLRCSGEIRCPECGSGNICYLVQRDRRTIVECSTPGCVKWDSRVAL